MRFKHSWNHGSLSTGSARWGILVGLVIVELLLLSFLQFSSTPVSHAFLIKRGAEYVVFWSQDGEYEFAAYNELKKAVAFAKTDLGLVKGATTGSAEIERLWTQDRSGSFVVFWKTFRFPHLNQLTFTRESEARFFAEAFRTGAYAPSPFGHSVLLLPNTR